MISDSTQSSGLRWLYVDFNSYFASVEQQLRPELRGKPMAVIPVETDSTCAIAVSYEAKAFGIKTGTPVWEAKKLCPSIVCVLAQHERYVEFHHRILEEVERHIPITAVCSIDEVSCRLMDNEISVKRFTEIAHSIKKGLSENVGKYVRCSIGIAPNRYLAKIATDMQKPDGFTVLSMIDLPERLLGLKLRDLPGIGHNMEKRLLRAGITDMSALLALDAGRLRKVWGSIWGEKIWYMLRGVEVQEEESVKRTIGHSHVMAPELRDSTKAIYVARRLMLKAASRLRRMDYYANALLLSVRIENGGRLEGGMRCYRAQDSMTFLRMLEELWKGLITEAKGVRVKKISITLDELVPASGLQPDLFKVLPDVDMNQRIRDEKLSRVLDKINHRFGRDSILIGMLPLQERSFSDTKIAFSCIPDVE
ncbi:MAG: impB/mucB/samB family protein [Candidatus Liberibacter ctenarytainae]|uniref:DNA-directed DNA polymerase n=1 Tax=Candidatus Liberibacter ctenarytainae TaxID=2020335 RepID=A0A937AIR4_9HYPH|nr:impB/mucB/samB family protein [Candidatus Liberibacter ctenarytainae]